MPASCGARIFLLSRQTKLIVPFTQGTVRIMAEVDNSVNVRFEGDLQQALEESLSSFPVRQLKAEQRFIIEKIVGRRDVFGQLPTGYGKSLTFQLLPGVLKSLNAKGYDFPSTPLVVVISPLMSIVEDQVKYLRSIGIQAAYIGEKGAFSLLFGSPESLTGDKKFREMFSKEFYQKNTVAVVCDEVHTAVHWGESTDNKDPFRKWCGRVGEIRSLLPQGVPLLALTATTTAATRKRIKNLLSFKQGVEIILPSMPSPCCQTHMRLPEVSYLQFLCQHTNQVFEV
ncbi:ATP-dependent DNA helicase RecQ-like [Porites lutea]|uniref:ATP-dependent DNA helicase RecQ-like n=1 Tax=Porites lutea TaxID=51062 RepID=UPI003CC5F597